MEVTTSATRLPCPIRERFGYYRPGTAGLEPKLRKMEPWNETQNHFEKHWQDEKNCLRAVQWLRIDDSPARR